MKEKKLLKIRSLPKVLQASYEINYVTYITATYTRAKRWRHGALEKTVENTGKTGWKTVGKLRLGGKVVPRQSRFQFAVHLDQGLLVVGCVRGHISAARRAWL
jgi:hypothetical protein